MTFKKPGWGRLNTHRPSINPHTALWILTILLMASSCIPHKKILLLQREAEQADTINFVKRDYSLKPGDILHIQVLTLDEETYTMYNSDRSGQRQMTNAGGGGIGNPQMYLQGYNVDVDGMVLMPVVGKVSVAGKTLEEASKTIDEKVKEYLIGATVLVKLVNFSVTVLGEVGSPGKMYIYDNRVSILDVIAASGDLTDFGNRNVTIIRQTDQGASYGSINLNDANAFQSPYYYLQPNDIVYVEPHKLKRLGISQFPFSLVFSSVSFVLFLVTYLNNR